MLLNAAIFLIYRESIVLRSEIQNVRELAGGPQRKAILILAGYRGGSTLTGEVFNRNPNVLYFFEPMALFGELDLPNEKLEFLNNTFHCQAPRYDKYSKLRKYSFNSLKAHFSNRRICQIALC